MTDRFLTEAEKAELHRMLAGEGVDPCVGPEEAIHALLDEIAALTNLLRDAQQEQAKLALALESARKERDELIEKCVNLEGAAQQVVELERERDELRADFEKYATEHAEPGCPHDDTQTRCACGLTDARRRWAKEAK